MNAQGACSAEELENVSYKDIDMVKVVPPATHAGYAVVGGSGFVGTYTVQLLIMRGETSIRILDVNPPAQKFLDHPSVSFVKTDITSLQSVRDALTAPFTTTGAPPTRASYCWDPSYRVNVIGTRNVLTVAKELPSAMVIYTSSAEPVSGCPKFLRENCYPRSKRMAEQLVISASANEGLKTGILRPGHTIIGPNDRLVSSTLMMPQTPIWDQPWTSTIICVWDDALNRIPEEVSGQGFLITGRGPAWNTENVRAAIKHYATRELVFIKLPPLLMYLLAHVMELFLFLRYHFLLPFFLLFGARPSLIPQWLGSAVFLQPATLDGQMIDLIIDDSRARKLWGVYQPQWDVAQAIRYSVDEIQSGNVAAVHGLKVQS
ncbi:hypothetical protein B0H13DRAFT_2231746 [Mycena leptocephala]|nr:hypothetical protein B0H13DRAFT_2231746 [Mycena leptocephala]